MKIKTKTFGDYVVELDHDEYGNAQCFVSRGRFSASLACLSDTGALTNHRDEEHLPPAWIIGQIEVWATANGY